MTMKKVAVAVASAGLAVAAFADVAVSNVVVQQRWPWNGKVDIDYEVFSDSPDDSVFVYPLGFENDRNIAIAPRTLTGEGVEPAMVGARVKPGKHRMTWEMDKDEPTLHSSAFTITMHAVKGGMYLVVDLSGGPNAENYPIRYSDVPPDITDDACRTTNLWLRLCLPGTFMMGSPTDEYGREPNPETVVGKETLHCVTLTKPFYIGVFEYTQRQYNLVTGGNPSTYKHDLQPVENISYNTIRGSVAGSAYPKHDQVDPDSFLGSLRARTGILFDLPTESQWEYACRAGTSSALNSGEPILGTDSCPNLAKLGRCYNNRNDARGGFSGAHTVVGSYEPNAWGIYDMHGNVLEWCLDWWQQDLGTSSLIDPRGPANAGTYRVWRGGCWVGCYGEGRYSASMCRSAFRNYGQRYSTYTGCYYYAKPNGGGSYIGFRVVAMPVVQ